jgi:peptidoglycan hydrolase-like protein with peptidoglycan-binding domain
MLMMMRADNNITKSTYLNFTSLRWTKIFVPSTGTTITSQFTATELAFIRNINKNFQFTGWYSAGQSSAGVKYLQYILKAKKYYTGSIDGINTQATVNALFQRQKDNNIISSDSYPAAGYLGPTTRDILNPLLKQLLNP